MTRITRALQALVRELDRLNGCSRCVGPSEGVDTCHGEAFLAALTEARKALKAEAEAAGRKPN